MVMPYFDVGIKEAKRSQFEPLQWSFIWFLHPDSISFCLKNSFKLAKNFKGIRGILSVSNIKVNQVGRGSSPDVERVEKEKEGILLAISLSS